MCWTAQKKRGIGSVINHALVLLGVSFLTFSLITLNTVSAATGPFKITDASIAAKSTDVDATIVSFEDAEINSEATFHRLNDSVTYLVTISNIGDKSYTINSITDNNTNTHLTYNYSTHAGEEIAAGSDLALEVEIVYTDVVAEITDRVQNLDIEFIIDYEEEDDIVVPDTGDDDAVVPDTGVGTNDARSKADLILPTTTAIGIILLAIGLFRSKLSNKTKVAALIFVGTLAGVSTAHAVSRSFAFEFCADANLKNILAIVIEGQDGYTVISYGDTLALDDPTASTGYKFSGWKDEVGNDFDPAAPIADDATIHPTFSPIQYTIAVDTDGDGAADTNLDAVYDTFIRLPQNTAKTGYDPGGWTDGYNNYLSGGRVVNLTAVDGDTIQLSPVYIPHQIVISFSRGEGVTDASGTVQDKQLAYNQSVTMPSRENGGIFSRPGYTQTGWECDVAPGTIFSPGEIIVNWNYDTPRVTCSAVWTGNQYTIHFVKGADDATGSMDDISSISYGDDTPLPLNTFAREGYRFTGWKWGNSGDLIEDGSSAGQFATTQGATVSLWAQWEVLPYAMLDTGLNFNKKIKKIVHGENIPDDFFDWNIFAIEMADALPADFDTEDTANIISAPDSPIKVYAWYDNDAIDVTGDEIKDGAIFVYSDASTIKGNPDMSYMFSGTGDLFSVSFLEYVDTSSTTDMSYMFYYTDLIPLSIPAINTANVTNMSYMFADSNAVYEPLVLPDSFDTSNVTDMSYMFWNVHNSVSLTLPDTFDTSNVTTMAHMFEGLEVEEVTLPDSFNTSNVTDMESMFSGLHATSFTLPRSFDTSNVTTMAHMFEGLEVEEVTLPDSFNTSNVTDMSYMFGGSTSLVSLTLPDSFNTSNVTNMGGMFSGMSSLTTLTLPDSFNTSSVTSMDSMFCDMTSLTTLTLPDSFNTSSVTSMSGMFSNTRALTTLTLPDSFNTSSVTNMNSMFSNMSSLTTLTLPDSFNTSNVTSMGYMFSGMSKLTTLTLPDSFNTSSVTSMNSMFYNMKALTTLTLPDSFIIGSDTTTSYIFTSIRTTATLYATNATVRSLWPGILGN